MDGGERVCRTHKRSATNKAKKEKRRLSVFSESHPQPGPYNILADRPIGCRSWPVYLVVLVLPFHSNSLIWAISNLFGNAGRGSDGRQRGTEYHWPVALANFGASGERSCTDEEMDLNVHAS